MGVCWQASPYCKPFLGAGSAEMGGKTIAIVGNGPLDDAQRSSIAAFDIVLRFNYLNNRYDSSCSYIQRYAEPEVGAGPFMQAAMF